MTIIFIIVIVICLALAAGLLVANRYAETRAAEAERQTERVRVKAGLSRTL